MKIKYFLPLLFFSFLLASCGGDGSSSAKPESQLNPDIKADFEIMLKKIDSGDATLADLKKQLTQYQEKYPEQRDELAQLFSQLTENRIIKAQPRNNSRLPEDVFQKAEEMPRFPGCETKRVEERNECANGKLGIFISENIQYPEEAKAKKLEGKVMVKFIVDTDGSVQNMEIVRPLCSDCDQEVLRVMNLMNEMEKKWIPGKNNGEPVKVQMILPVKFRLDS